MKDEPPQTRIQKKNTDMILQAGLEVFSTYGFRGSTLDQIAESAGLSKPNLLYYFRSKDAIYVALLAGLMDEWLAPLRAVDAAGDPLEENLSYVRRKLQMSRDFPQESRLFANEMIQGAPHIKPILDGDLKSLVDAKIHVIEDWVRAGKIAQVNPHHLIFSIWSLTQHYADFDVQVRAILDGQEPFDEAGEFLEQLYRKMLTVA